MIAMPFFRKEGVLNLAEFASLATKHLRAPGAKDVASSHLKDASAPAFDCIDPRHTECVCFVCVFQ